MSSHHIVRDEQEPALLLWQEGQATFEQAGELLEWSPRVIVHQQALMEALGWGIKLDAVWALPGAQEEIKAATAHQQPVEILSLPPEASTLQTVLQWLAAKNQRSLHLAADAEIQHFSLLKSLEPLQQLMQVQVVCQGWRYSFFSKAVVQKWFPAQTALRIIAFREHPQLKAGVCQAGKSTQPLQQLITVQDGLFDISSQAPFWLGERF